MNFPRPISGRLKEPQPLNFAENCLGFASRLNATGTHGETDAKRSKNELIHMSVSMIAGGGHG